MSLQQNYLSLFILYFILIIFGLIPMLFKSLVLLTVCVFWKTFQVLTDLKTSFLQIIKYGHIHFITKQPLTKR